MIGDDFSQIGRIRAFRNNRRRVGDMLEERPIGEKRASRHEDDARVRTPIAREIRRCDGTAVFEHDVKDEHFRFSRAEKIRRLILACHDMDFVALPFQVPRPNLRKLFI